MRDRKATSGAESPLQDILHRFWPAFIALCLVALTLLTLTVVQGVRSIGRGKTDIFRTSEAQETAYAFDGIRLTAAHSDSLSIFTATGKTVAETVSAYSSPRCSASEKVSIFYQPGETGFDAVYPDGSVFHALSDDRVEFASANKSGRVCVIYRVSATHHLLIVYSSDLTALCQIDITNTVPKFAGVSESGVLCFSCETARGEVLRLFRLKNAEEIGSLEITDDAFLQAEFLPGGETLAVLSRNRLLFLNSEGQVFHEITFGRFTPAALAVSSDIVAVASNSSSGTVSTVTVLDPLGNILASHDFPLAVQDLAAAEERLLILFNSESTLFTSAMEEIVSYQQPEAVSQVFLRTDNVAFYAGNEGAFSIDFGRDEERP